MRDSKPYPCRWTDESIHIDGRLDEESWKRAERLDGFLVAGKEQPANFGTVARLLWSNTHLYFAATMDDADIYGLHEGHDCPFGGDDVIELFIKPSRSAPPYWEFHVTPRGATRDYFWARRAAGPEARWMAYDSGMQAAVTLDGTLNHWEDRDRSWTAELAIPWTAFEKTGGPARAGDRWTFLVSRYDYSVYQENGVELSTSCHLPQANFHLQESYGELLFTR